MEMRTIVVHPVKDSAKSPLTVETIAAAMIGNRQARRRGVLLEALHMIQQASRAPSPTRPVLVVLHGPNDPGADEPWAVTRVREMAQEGPEALGEFGLDAERVGEMLTPGEHFRIIPVASAAEEQEVLRQLNPRSTVRVIEMTDFPPPIVRVLVLSYDDPPLASGLELRPDELE